MSNQNHTLLLEDDFAHLGADAIAFARPLIQGDKKRFLLFAGDGRQRGVARTIRPPLQPHLKTFRARQRPLILGLSRLKRLLP